MSASLCRMIHTRARNTQLQFPDCCKPRPRARAQARRPSSIRGGTPERERPFSPRHPGAAGPALVPAGQWHRATSVPSVPTRHCRRRRRRDPALACRSDVGGFSSNVSNAIVIGGGSCCRSGGNGRGGVGAGSGRGWRLGGREHAGEQQQSEGCERGRQGAERCLRWGGGGAQGLVGRRRGGVGVVEPRGHAACRWAGFQAPGEVQLLCLLRRCVVAVSRNISRKLYIRAGS